MTVMNVSLNASPVSPEVETEEVWAPELAKLVALPTAVALPEVPEVPLSPEVAGSGGAAPLTGMNTLEPPTGMEMPPAPLLPPNTLAMPRMPVFRAKGLLVAAPLVPGVPDVPEVEAGLESAVEVAFPVSPELVALDWARDAPLSPVMALGLAVTSAEPPAPPPELLVDTTLPAPMTTPGVSAAPLPPSPPDGFDLGEVGGVARLPRLRAGASAMAPELARLLARPVAVAAPLSPVPGSVVVGVHHGGGGLRDGGRGRLRHAQDRPMKTRTVAMPAPMRALADVTRAVPALPILMLIPF